MRDRSTPLLVLLLVCHAGGVEQSMGLPPTRAEAYAAIGTDLGNPLFSFAVFADTQYGTGRSTGMRHYQRSLKKLQEMGAFLRDHEVPLGLSLVVNLGDLTQDKANKFRQKLLDEIKKYIPTVPVYHVLGNHDFQGIANVMDVYAGFGLNERHYIIDNAHVEQAKFRMIVVDTTEISTFGAAGSREHSAAVAMSAKLHKAGAQHWQTHNGAVGHEQRKWLEAEVSKACALNYSVLLLGHGPLLTGRKNNDMHVWDKEELLALVARHRCVRAWINGHVHVHRHVTLYQDEGHFVHLWTTSGMVQTPGNSFVVVDVHRDFLFVRGVSWGTSFHKFFNFTSPLSRHGYDYNASTFYLKLAHLATVSDHSAPLTAMRSKQGDASPPTHPPTPLPPSSSPAPLTHHPATQEGAGLRDTLHQAGEEQAFASLTIEGLNVAAFSVPFVTAAYLFFRRRRGVQ